MKNKKWHISFLAGALVLLLTACSGGAVNSNTSSQNVSGGAQSVASKSNASYSTTQSAETDHTASRENNGTQSVASKNTASQSVSQSVQSLVSSQAASLTASEGTQSESNSKPVKQEGKDMIWVGPKSIDYTTGMVMDDFVDKLTDASNWSTILKQTRVLKLYIQQIYTTPEKDLERIADFVREQGLLVAVELGGVRVAPVDTLPNQVGTTAAAAEYQHLKTFIDNGGRVDYITTDHALAAEITGRSSNYPQLDMEGLMRQQMEYYRYMLQRIPNLKVGAIESLGFFWVQGDRQYRYTDVTLPIRVDFEVYLSEMVRLATEYSITLDHFHIDFGYHDVVYDGGYGRILAVEDYCHRLGVDAGFIAANAFHAAGDYPTSNETVADQSAYQRTLDYLDGYMEAGGRSDYLLFQRWQYYPIAVGTENDKYTNMGIFKAMLAKLMLNREWLGKN